MDYDVDLVDVQAAPAVVVRGEVAPDGISGFLGGAYGEVMQALAEQGVEPAGPPFARYTTSEVGYGIEAGFPVTAPVRETGRVVNARVPGGHAARTLHHGGYDDLPEAYDALGDWLTSNGFEPNGEPWESYLDGPDVPEPRTLVYFPCASLRRD